MKLLLLDIMRLFEKNIIFRKIILKNYKKYFFLKRKIQRNTENNREIRKITDKNIKIIFKNYIFKNYIFLRIIFFLKFIFLKFIFLKFIFLKFIFLKFIFLKFIFF
jgi:hypothetical protein